MDQQTLELIKQLASKVVIDKVLNEVDIKTALAQAIDELVDQTVDQTASQTASQTVDSTVELLINNCYGGFSYSDEFLDWLKAAAPNIHSEMYNIIESYADRKAAASVMVDFGKHMVGKKGLQSALSHMNGYLTLIEPLPAWLRDEDIELYKQLLLMDRSANNSANNSDSKSSDSDQASAYAEVVARLRPWCQDNLEKIMLAVSTLADLISPEQLSDCLSGYRSDYRTGLAGSRARLLPYNFSLYVFSKYLEAQQQQQLQQSQTTALADAVVTTTDSIVIPDSVYQQLGLYFASGNHCKLEIAKVKRYRDWQINEYDGKEYISY